MAVRSHERLNGALIMQFDNSSMPAFSRGQEVKFNGSDTLLQAAGTNDVLAIGVIYQSNAAGRTAHVVLYGHAIMPVTVGTGGATRGVDATTVADGFTDAATNGAGTVSQIIKGKFMQSGVAGDVVGMLIGINQRSVKA